MKRNFILIILAALILMSCSQNPKMDSGKKFSYDTDGMIMINGKRTFILGSYHLSKSAEPYKELSDAGFNLVRTGAVKEEMDAAARENLFAWTSIGSIDPQKPEMSSEKLVNVVKQFKDHPALLFWELVDEPAFIWNSALPRVKPGPLIETYNLVKEKDPDHLLYMNHGPVNLVSTLQKYNPATDIVACDVYPVIPHGIKPSYALFADGLQGDLLNPYISQVGEYMDKMQKVVAGKKPVFAVLQGFAWEMLKEEKERDPEMVQYPTFKESRFMAYNAVIHGATGIMYWGMSYTPQPSPFWSDLLKLTSELKEMSQVLAAPEIEMGLNLNYIETGHSIDTGVEVLVKSSENVKYLLTANADKNPVELAFHGLEGYSQAKVLFEDRVINIEQGELLDEYDPFDVHIYELVE